MNPNHELADGKIIVRTYREEEAAALYEAVRESIAEVSVWLPWCHENYSIEESREFVVSRELASQGDKWYSFAVFEKDAGRFLGGVGLNFINRVHQVGNLGYWVRTSAAGSGIATQAARLVARFGFETTRFASHRNPRGGRQHGEPESRRESGRGARRHAAKAPLD